jgi:hypothetical protein
LVHPSSSEPRKRAPLIDRILPFIILVFGTLSIVLALTGGVDLRHSGIPFSSRDWFRPAIVTLVATLIFTTRHRAAVIAWIAWLARHGVRGAPAVAIALSCGVFFVGMKYGSHVASNADSYGYVSQAWLWANGGDLTIEQPFATEMSLPYGDFPFAPLGYRPSLGGGGIVPTYAPGLPILMAALMFPFGECGPYLVVPLLGGLLVWVTYKIGERVTSSRPLGFAAAVLMASSPTFLFMLMPPMSDVPVAALFCSAVLAALTPMRGRAFVTGLLVGLSVLVRPNLAPMAAVFAVYLAWLDGNWRDRFITLIAFGIGCLPSVIAVAIIHTHLYGAPWKSGYGDFNKMFAWSFLSTNARQYLTWLAETQTPAMLLCLVPLLAMPKLPAERRPMVALLGAFAAGIWLCYLFYVPFDAWWYLRFLLSSFPPLLVLAVLGSQLSLRWMSPAPRAVVLIAMVAAVAGYQLSQVQDKAVLHLGAQEAVYYSTGRYVRRVLPKNAIVLSGFHSGSVRMYGERLTLRYDWIDPANYQRVLETLVAKGYRPYLVLGEGEERDFRTQFNLPQTPGDSAPGVLIAELTQPGTVRLYDPLRETPVGTPRVIPALIPHPCRF